MTTEKEEIHSTQLRYKRKFDERVRLPRLKVILGYKVFLKYYYHPTDYPRQKLEPIATGPYQVTEVDYKACVILIEYNVTEIDYVVYIFVST